MAEGLQPRVVTSAEVRIFSEEDFSKKFMSDEHGPAIKESLRGIPQPLKRISEEVRPKLPLENAAPGDVFLWHSTTWPYARLGPDGKCRRYWLALVGENCGHIDLLDKDLDYCDHIALEVDTDDDKQVEEWFKKNKGRHICMKQRELFQEGDEFTRGYVITPVKILSFMSEKCNQGEECGWASESSSTSTIRPEKGKEPDTSSDDAASEQ